MMSKKVSKTLKLKRPRGSNDNFLATPGELMPPSWFSPEAVAKLAEVVAILTDRDGGIRRDDVYHVLAFAESYGAWSEAGAELQKGGLVVTYVNKLKAPSPWLKVQKAALSRMDKAGFALGMHFAARRKSGVGKEADPKSGDALLKFLREQ